MSTLGVQVLKCDLSSMRGTVTLAKEQKSTNNAAEELPILVQLDFCERKGLIGSVELYRA